jgi:ADP-ribose pyrophosphatase
VWLFLATGLTAAQEPAEGDEDERIEIVPWPLDDLDGALAESEDSKTLIALLWLAARLDVGASAADSRRL